MNSGGQAPVGKDLVLYLAGWARKVAVGGINRRRELHSDVVVL